MLTEVRVPAVSETVKSGKVVTVLVSVGDAVEPDQPLIELETDKAVVEIPSPAAGVVARLDVAPGQTVEIGGVILALETAAAGGATGADTAPPAAAPPAAPAVAASATTTRAAAVSPAPAPAAAPVAPVAPVAPAAPAPLPAAAAPGLPPLERELAPASPSVRRLAREIGVDLAAVTGTGPRGRITEKDVKEHARAAAAGASASAGAAAGAAGAAAGIAAGTAAGIASPAGAAAPAPAAAASARPLPDLGAWGPVAREPLSRVREVTAETMAHAWATIPQVTQHDKADVTELEAFRRAYAERHPEAKLTMTAILVKVVAAALRAFPRFNAALDLPRRELVLRQYVHVGVAVDTEHGLLVPVIRDADGKGILRIAAELADLAARARARKVLPAELEGGGFTISNLGGIGGTGFSPIVYPPQVAILGVSRAATEPVWRDGQFAPRLLLPLALTYDHRVVDGADGARFARWLAEALQQPLLLHL